MLPGDFDGDPIKPITYDWLGRPSYRKAYLKEKKTLKKLIKTIRGILSGKKKKQVEMGIVESLSIRRSFDTVSEETAQVIAKGLQNVFEGQVQELIDRYLENLTENASEFLEDFLRFTSEIEFKKDSVRVTIYIEYIYHQNKKELITYAQGAYIKLPNMIEDLNTNMVRHIDGVLDVSKDKVKRYEALRKLVSSKTNIENTDNIGCS